jgi:hypothetical protein
MSQWRNRAFGVCALGAAFAFFSGTVRIAAAAQNAATSQAKGRIVGTIKPRAAGYSIRLFRPNSDKPVQDMLVDSIARFSLDAVEPGSYRLQVAVFQPFACGFLPWSQDITVRTGETVYVKAKLKRVPNARCE